MPDERLSAGSGGGGTTEDLSQPQDATTADSEDGDGLSQPDADQTATTTPEGPSVEPGPGVDTGSNQDGVGDTGSQPPTDTDTQESPDTDDPATGGLSPDPDDTAGDPSPDSGSPPPNDTDTRDDTGAGDGGGASDPPEDPVIDEGPGGAVNAPGGDTEPDTTTDQQADTTDGGEDTLDTGETYDPDTDTISDSGDTTITEATTGATGRTTQQDAPRDYLDETPGVSTTEVKRQLASEVIQSEPGVDSLSTDQVRRVGSGAYVATFVRNGEQVTRRFAVSDQGQEYFQEEAARQQLEEQGLEPEDYTLTPTEDGVEVTLTDQGLVDEEFQQSQLEQNLGDVAAQLGLDREDIRVTDEGSIELTVMGRGEVGRDIRTDIQDAAQRREVMQDTLIETQRRGFDRFRPRPRIDTFAQSRYEARQPTSQRYQGNLSGLTRDSFRTTAVETSLTEDQRASIRADYAESVSDQSGADVSPEDVELDVTGGEVEAQLTDTARERVSGEDPVLGDAVGTTEIFGFNLEDDFVDPAGGFVGGVAKGGSRVVLFTPALTAQLAGREQLAEDIYYGGSQVAAGLGEIPGETVEIGEGLYAGLEEQPSFITLLGYGDISEEAGDYRQFQQTAVSAASTRVSRTIEFAQENPVATAAGLAASLPLTYGAFRGAAAIGPRTNLATRYAIQPGEEIVVGTARATGVTSRLASAVPIDTTRFTTRADARTAVDEGDIDTATRTGRLQGTLSELSDRTPDVGVRVDPDAPVIDIDPELRSRLTDISVRGVGEQVATRVEQIAARAAQGPGSTRARLAEDVAKAEAAAGDPLPTLVAHRVAAKSPTVSGDVALQQAFTRGSDLPFDPGGVVQSQFNRLAGGAQRVRAAPSTLRSLFTRDPTLGVPRARFEQTTTRGQMRGRITRPGEGQTSFQPERYLRSLGARGESVLQRVGGTISDTALPFDPRGFASTQLGRVTNAATATRSLFTRDPTLGVPRARFEQTTTRGQMRGRITRPGELPTGTGAGIDLETLALGLRGTPSEFIATARQRAAGIPETLRTETTNLRFAAAERVETGRQAIQDIQDLSLKVGRPSRAGRSLYDTEQPTTASEFDYLDVGDEGMARPETETETEDIEVDVDAGDGDLVAVERPTVDTEPIDTRRTGTGRPRELGPLSRTVLGRDTELQAPTATETMVEAVTEVQEPTVEPTQEPGIESVQQPSVEATVDTEIASIQRPEVTTEVDVDVEALTRTAVEPVQRPRIDPVGAVDTRIDTETRQALEAAQESRQRLEPGFEVPRLEQAFEGYVPDPDEDEAPLPQPPAFLTQDIGNVVAPGSALIGAGITPATGDVDPEEVDPSELDPTGGGLEALEDR